MGHRGDEEFVDRVCSWVVVGAFGMVCEVCIGGS